MRKKISKIVDKLTDDTAQEFVANAESVIDTQSVLSYLFKNLKLIVLIAILSIIYISNRMVCEQQYSKIDKLNKELTKTKYISMITEAELLDLSRPDKIQKLIDDYNLQLQQQDCPPYKLIFKEE